MRKADVFPSKYLKAEGLAIGGGRYGTLTLTIESVSTSEPFEDGKVQRVLHFKEDGRELGLNATNWDTIAYITGKDDDDHWAGARVELYVDPMVRFGGKTVPAIRVRAPQGTQPVGGNFPNNVNPQVLAQSNGTHTLDTSTAQTAAPAKVQASAANKAEAWKAWKGFGGSPEDFKSAAESVASSSGVAIDAFGPAQWSAVLDQFIPF